MRYRYRQGDSALTIIKKGQKNHEEIMGVEEVVEFKKRQSEMRKGRVVSEETKKDFRNYKR